MRPSKVACLILGVFVLFLSTLNLLADVIVYDEKGIQDSLSKDQEKKDAVTSTSEAGGLEGKASDTSDTGTKAKTGAEAQKPELGPGGMSITLEGMRMGDTVTSSSIILSKTGVIIDVKTEPIGLGFSIMRVDKNGEIPVIEGSSSLVLRKKLSAGTYKVYPAGNLPGGAASTEKTKVSITIGPE